MEAAVGVFSPSVRDQVRQSRTSFISPSQLFHVGLLSAAILDDQSSCGRGERLALALAREKVNSLMESSSQSRVEVDVYELKNDSQYTTTDTSESQYESLVKKEVMQNPEPGPGPGCYHGDPHNYTFALLVCQILPKGVVSVIGPASSPASGSAVSHICGEKEVSFQAYLAAWTVVGGSSPRRSAAVPPSASCQTAPQIPHVKIGPEETPKLPYLRFASVTLHPSNEDLSMAIGSMLRSFGYPTTSIICAKAECECPVSASFGSAFSFYFELPVGVIDVLFSFELAHEFLVNGDMPLRLLVGVVGWDSMVCAISVTPPPSGLLRLEELVQSFLISKETLSVRWLDDNLDPTPLLKEIRDDKVATIIIDANASVSYRILKKVRVAINIRVGFMFPLSS